MPTEAEWEGAARCGTDLPYAGADGAAEVAWTSENAGDTTHPVAQLDPNACGLFDLTGNVWEWVGDWYDLTYYEVSPSHDPAGPTTGLDKAYRGGAWSHDPWTVSDRAGMPSDTQMDRIGVRLARTLP